MAWRIGSELSVPLEVSAHDDGIDLQHFRRVFGNPSSVWLGRRAHADGLALVLGLAVHSPKLSARWSDGSL